MSAYIQNLTEAVTALHGCDCVHSGTSRVVEFYEAQKVFDGDVETFPPFLGTRRPARLLRGPSTMARSRNTWRR